MEYVDVLDEDGKPTGEKKLKSDAHKYGYWHRAVHVWIVNSRGELLIQKRSSILENHPNMWDISSAGHVSAGENSITSAIREVNEELGLEVEEKDFEFLFSLTERSAINNGTYINNEFNDVYLLKLDLDLSKLKLQKEEVAEVKFIHYKKLDGIVGSGDKEFVDHSEEYDGLFRELRRRY